MNDATLGGGVQTSGRANCFAGAKKKVKYVDYRFIRNVVHDENSGNDICSMSHCRRDHRFHCTEYTLSYKNDSTNAKAATQFNSTPVVSPRCLKRVLLSP
jgi:hypothetical protein